MQSERDALLSQVPARWEAEHKAFRNLQRAEEKARKTYRKNIDGAYLPVRALREIVADTGRLAALEGDLVALRASLPETEPGQSVDKIAAMTKAVGRVAGAKAIRADLSAARRALRAKRPDMNKALKKFDSAIKKFRSELAWRERATTELLPELEAYEASIRDTIGLRQQPRMPREQATELIGCTAEHRDLSLHF